MPVTIASVNPTGRTYITSTVNKEAQRFKLTRTENGGPDVSELTRHSFGTRLIGLLAKLHGDVRIQSVAQGGVIRCVWSCKPGPKVE